MSKTGGKLADPTFRATWERPQASNSGSNLDIFPQNLGNYVRIGLISGLRGAPDRI